MAVTLLRNVLILTLLFSGTNTLAQLAEEESKPDLPIKVTVVGSEWYGHIPVWVGIETGIFRKQGFDVEWKWVRDSGDRIKEISEDKAHFASVGMIAMVKSMADCNKGFYWIGNQDHAPGFEGLVVGEGIDDYSDLRGKKIGVPRLSSAHFTCFQLLEQNGFNPIKDDSFKFIKIEDIVEVFNAKDSEIDAACVWEPELSRLLAMQGTKLLETDKNTALFEKYKGMTGPDVLLINRAWADNNTIDARRFRDAYFEVVKYMIDDDESAIESMIGKYLWEYKHEIKNNLDKLTWFGSEQQWDRIQCLSEQAEELKNILDKKMGEITPKECNFEYSPKRFLYGLIDQDIPESIQEKDPCELPATPE